MPRQLCHLCTILCCKTHTLATEWAYLAHAAVIAAYCNCSTNSISVYCVILTQAVLWDTGMCTEPRLLRNIDLFISQLASACISHIGLQALNQTDMRL